MKEEIVSKSREKDCFGHLKLWKFHIFVSRKTGTEFRCCDVINRVKRCSPLFILGSSLDWKFCGREYLAEMSSDDEVMSLEDFSSTGSFMAAVETEILNRSTLNTSSPTLFFACPPGRLLSCTRFITSQLCNQIYLAERKVETLWRVKFEWRKKLQVKRSMH